MQENDGEGMKTIVSIFLFFQRLIAVAPLVSSRSAFKVGRRGYTNSLKPYQDLNINCQSRVLNGLTKTLLLYNKGSIVLCIDFNN